MRRAAFDGRAGSGGEPGHATTVVVGGRVVTPDGIRSADVVIENGHIAAIKEPGGNLVGTVIEAAGLLVLPGLVDLQINGGFGHDFTSDPERIWDVGTRLPESGVTAFLPTIISSSRDTIAKAQDVMAGGPPSGYMGAVPLGLHLEGPMLSPQRPGAHDPSLFEVPSLDLIEGWSAEGKIRMVTLAPELAGACAIIQALGEHGVIVSLGHSNASYGEAVEAIRCGAAFGTHLYNAMPPFDHREPGLVGALLATRRSAAGIIVDGIHVHPGAVRTAWRAKGPDGLVLVTDAIAAMGMGHGSFNLGGIQVTVDDTGPRNQGGNLAGSTLTLERAMRNMVSFTRCSEVDAVSAATLNPARVLKDPERGSLEVGLRGDVAVTDLEFNVKVTLVGGDVVFCAEPSLQEGNRS